MDFHEFLHFLKAEIEHINKIHSPWNGKNGISYIFKIHKIDFTLNPMDSKIFKVSTGWGKNFCFLPAV